MTKIMNKFLLVFLIILLVLTIIYINKLKTREDFISMNENLTKEISNTSLTGRIVQNQIWSGTINITGDLLISKNVTVIVEPGTKILIKANYDDQGTGGENIIDEITNLDPSATSEYTKTHTGISVEGVFIAKGTQEEKIVFTSDSDNPTHTDWDGIIFNPTSSGEMKHCVVEWTHTGPALHGTNEVKISHCTIKHTFWGGLHAFQNSPVFEYNVLEDIGHEAFDTHKASPIIRHNNISYSRSAVVFNYYDLNTNNPIIFEDNILQDNGALAQLQENAKAIIRNNKFIGSNDTGGPWTYEGFILKSDSHSAGIHLADNVDVEIMNNTFINFEGPAISYELIGPNRGIGHTTNIPEPFNISGPVKILIKNNLFDNIQDKRELEKMKKELNNVILINNTYNK